MNRKKRNWKVDFIVWGVGAAVVVAAGIAYWANQPKGKADAGKDAIRNIIRRNLDAKDWEEVSWNKDGDLIRVRFRSISRYGSPMMNDWIFQDVGDSIYVEKDHGPLHQYFR